MKLVGSNVGNEDQEYRCKRKNEPKEVSSSREFSLKGNYKQQRLIQDV